MRCMGGEIDVGHWRPRPDEGHIVKRIACPLGFALMCPAYSRGAEWAQEAVGDDEGDAMMFLTCLVNLPRCQVDWSVPVDVFIIAVIAQVIGIFVVGAGLFAFWCLKWRTP